MKTFSFIVAAFFAFTLSACGQVEIPKETEQEQTTESFVTTSIPIPGPISSQEQTTESFVTTSIPIPIPIPIPGPISSSFFTAYEQEEVITCTKVVMKRGKQFCLPQPVYSEISALQFGGPTNPTVGEYDPATVRKMENERLVECLEIEQTTNSVYLGDGNSIEQQQISCIPKSKK